MNNYRNLSINFFAWIIGLLFLSCRSEIQENLTVLPDPLLLEKPTIFLTSGENEIYYPDQIEFIDNTGLAVLDSQTNRIHILSHQPKTIASFGGEGRGPGETVYPRTFQVSDQFVYVVDSVLMTVHQFSFEGEFLRSFNFDTGVFEAVIAVADSGIYYRSALGEDDKLILKTDTRRSVTELFGEAMGKAFHLIDMQSQRQMLQNGEIPELFKNRIIPLFNDGHLFVFLNSFSRLQKYTPEGELVWETDIDLPVNEKIFNRAVEQSRRPGDSNAVPTINYISSMAVAAGETFLLWYPRDDSPRQIVRINRDGEILAIYELPSEPDNQNRSYSDIAIDPTQGYIYLTSPTTGNIYRTKIPD
jgi:DNA-binding beta-propeller fold protein YncE